jgi:uncharacterized transporter YbjL
MNNTKVGESIAIVLIAAIVAVVAVIFTEGAVVNRMKRQSVEGYVATPYYQTNAAREVTIKNITWEKK